MKPHRKLIDKGKSILLERGYKAENIIEEYTLLTKDLSHSSYIQIDIVGIKGKIKTAIECGFSPDTRIKYLKKHFDEVIYLPYIQKDGGFLICGACENKWKPRKQAPVSCPRCKRRFDYPNASEVKK